MRSSFSETIKGVLAFGVSSSLVSAVGFILIPLYTRYLSVEEFGLLGLINLTVSVSAAIFGLGLNSSIFRSYFDYDDKVSQKKLVGTALLLACSGSIGLVIIAAIFAEPLIAQRVFSLPDTGQYFRIAMYSAAIGLLSAIPLAVYRADRLFTRFAVFNTTAALLQMIFIIVLVVPFHLGVMGILIGQFVATLIVNGLLLYSVRNKVAIALLNCEIRKLLTYGLPLVPGAVSYLILTNGSLYFVQTTGGLADVGIFSLAIRIASIFTIIVITPFQLIWPPMMFSVEKTDYSNRFYANMLIYVMYVSVVIGAIIGVFARDVVRMISTQVYEPASRIVGFLLLGHVLFIAQNVFNVGIILKRKTAFWSAAIVIETIISVLLWLILAPKWGIEGIAIASIVGCGAGAGLTLVFSRRFLKIQYDWRRALFLLVLLPISIGISWIIPDELGAMSIVLKGILVLLILGCPFLVKFWHPDEISAAKQLFRQAVGKLVSSQ